MRSQSPQEMLSIAIPILMAVIGFVVLMGGFFNTQVSVTQAFIPYKVISMVSHSLTGSTDCLVLDTGMPHKGLLDQQKVEAFAAQYTDAIPSCVQMPCWVFRATVKDLSTDDRFVFGYLSADTDYWENDESGTIMTMNLPVVLDNETWRHFGKLTVDARPIDAITCQNQVQAILSGGSS